MVRVKKRLKLDYGKKCLLCGKYFFSYDMRTKYCSKECSKQATRLKRNIYHQSWYETIKESKKIKTSNPFLKHGLE